MKIVFGMYKGFDIIGKITEDGSKIVDVWRIDDMPTENGAFPFIRPFRTSLFNSDVNGNMLSFEVEVNEVEFLKTEQEMRIVADTLVNLVVERYTRITSPIIQESKPKIII